MRARPCDISSDGRLLLSTHTDGLRLWSLPEGRQVARLAEDLAQADDDFGFNVLSQLDGRGFVTAGADGLRYWPIATQDDGGSRHLRVGPPARFGPAKGMYILAQRPDGRTLATVTREDASSIHVFDMETRQEKLVPKGPERTHSVTLSPDGRWIAASSFSFKRAQVWELPSGKPVPKLPDTQAARAAFSPDNRWLIISTRSEHQFWEVGPWTLHHNVPCEGTGGRAGMAAFAPGGHLMALSGSQSAIRLLDPATEREFATLETPEGLAYYPFCFSPDGDCLAVPGTDRVLQLWNLRAIRRQLAALNLDWEAPPLPPLSTNAPSLRVTVHNGTNGLSVTAEPPATSVR